MAEKEEKSVDTKSMLKENAKKERKIKLNDRMKVEVIKATKHLVKGRIITPHRVMAEQLIKDGVAKEVK